jgi:hypothetical protein
MEESDEEYPYGFLWMLPLASSWLAANNAVIAAILVAEKRAVVGSSCRAVACCMQCDDAPLACRSGAWAGLEADRCNGQWPFPSAQVPPALDMSRVWIVACGRAVLLPRFPVQEVDIAAASPRESAIDMDIIGGQRASNSGQYRGRLLLGDQMGEQARGGALL